MNLVRYAMIGLLLNISQQGTAGMIQDPARIRLLGYCGKLESSALKFDEQGHLQIDTSSLPPLTPDLRKVVCQIKIPFTADSNVMAGSWQMEAKYKAAQGSKVLSTVRFSGVGEVGPARIWSIDEPSTSPLVWNETWSIPDESQEEKELKVTWTSELQIPKDHKESPPPGCKPAFQVKRITFAPPLPEPVPEPAPTPIE